MVCMAIAAAPFQFHQKKVDIPNYSTDTENDRFRVLGHTSVFEKEDTKFHHLAPIKLLEISADSVGSCKGQTLASCGERSKGKRVP